MHAVLPLHWTRPVEQAQLPLWQVLSLEQAFPHAPQLALSVAGVMQVPLHCRPPDGHGEPPVPGVPPVPGMPPVPVAPPLPVAPPVVPSPPVPTVPPVSVVPPLPVVPLVPDENAEHEATRAPTNSATDI